MPDDSNTPTAADQAAPNGPAAGASHAAQQVDNILTLDRIMSSARKVRRTATICLRADLEAKYLQASERLGDLVTPDGQLVTSDESLGDAAEVTELRDHIRSLREQMRAETYRVEFEAMNSDDWESFEKANRKPGGEIKNLRDYNNRIIAACAVSPTFTVDEVDQMRSRLTETQMVELSNNAYYACTTGGIDAPKLPNCFHSRSPQES